jgi:GH35 family endo-1,4-beta-xylanase
MLHSPWFTLVAAMIALALGRCALGAQTAPPASQVIVQDDPAQFTLTGDGRGKADANIVNVTGQPFSKAWHVKVREKVGADYNLQFICKPQTTLKVGDVILLTAYARMIYTADESGEGRVSFVLEQAKDPFGKVFASSFGVGRQWQRFDVPAVIDRDLNATGAQFTIRVGAYVQTLEIGGLEVRQFAKGTDVKLLPRTRVSYAGRAADAPWRQAAAERIEKIRKAPLTVTVVDGSGKPVANADVHVCMTRHAFVFGSCYSPSLILDNVSADAQKYRQTFLKLFNTGVDEYAMKWPGWNNPKTRQTALDALKWMRDHGIAVRGHNMVWPGWKRMPPAVKASAGDPAALRQMIREHILSVGAAMRGQVIDWDVVNEPYANNDLMKILGEDAMADWFKTARQADPTAKLYLNETSVPTSPPSDERYAALYNRVRHLQELGAPIDGIGMQAHFGQNVQPPAQLLGIYDRFATLGLPVRITELDIDSNDEQLQADYFRDFLTASFSHPNINGILLWGFWESAHWRPNAAMYRKDWSPRPIAGVWKDLVFKQWWTDQRASTSDAGTIQMRGFLGDYDITATVGTRTTTAKAMLSEGGASVRVTLPN